MFAVVLATTKDWNSNLHKLLLEEKKHNMINNNDDKLKIHIYSMFDDKK